MTWNADPCAAARVRARRSRSAATASAADDADTVIVKYRDGVSAGAAGVSAPSARACWPAVSHLRHLREGRARLRRPRGVAATLNRCALVAYAEVNTILRTTAVPNDPRFGELYGLNNTGQGGGTAEADIDAPEGWDAAGLGAFPATRRRQGRASSTPGSSPRTRTWSARPPTARSRTGPADLRRHDPGGLAARTTTATARTSPGTISATRTTRRASPAWRSTRRWRSARRWAARSAPASTSDVANCIRWAHDKGARVISMSLGGGASTTLQHAVHLRLGRRRHRRLACWSPRPATTATRR